MARKTMKLWLLERSDDRWDVAIGFIVRAHTELRARQLAAELAGDEGAAASWLDPRRANCERLLARGLEDVILRDYQAG